jgi:hypothetical protein
MRDTRTPGKEPADTLDDILEIAKKRKAKSNNILSDDALALAFVERHGPDLRYAAAWSKWLKWASMRWEQEKTSAAFDLARKIVRETTGHEGTTQ